MFPKLRQRTSRIRGVERIPPAQSAGAELRTESGVPIRWPKWPFRMFIIATELMLSAWYRFAPQPLIQKVERWKGPEQLNVGNLKKAQGRLQSRGLMNPELRRCFELALEEFPREPLCVQNNAQLVIELGGQRLVFVSGAARCEITVSHTNGEPHYHVQEPTGDVYLARLCSRPQPLTVETLQGVQDALEKRGVPDKKLVACLKRALVEFPREPRCVQRNAQMVIRHDHTELVFVSGQGKCEITVSEGDGEPCYKVKESTVMVYWKWLRSHPQRLSVGSLQRIRDRLESWGVMTKELRCSFDLVLREFPKEPECVRENAKMCVSWDETKLRLISEDGDCEVSVTCCDGKPSYEVKVKSWAMYQERMHLSEQPLSIENLEGVRREVRGLSGTPEKVKETLNVAVKDFSNELGCLQENTRLVIECDRGEMVFVSGKGENKVNVCTIDGKPSYNVRATTLVAFWREILKLFHKLWEALVKFISQVLGKVLDKVLGKVLGKVLDKVLGKVLPI
ncbi:uncharacterized protein LOC101940633 [Chrysemys picta bellii]|uniref:uncharacterized protein LOC101940633 n=1 Tax=Chrysemys picta bellii TaxID=8478 RepID=UPI0032B1CA41